MPSARIHKDDASRAASGAWAASVFVAGLVFVVWKAVAVPLTYDEAAAYLRFIATDLPATLNFAVATNHLLHTALTRLFHAVAGDGEFVLRLPSMMGFALYSWFAYLITARLRHRVIAAAGFTLLHLNLYMLDFFALSRGYGLSLGLLMGAVYCLVRFLTAGDPASARRLLSWSLALAGAAVLANFVMLNVYLAIVAVAAGSLWVSTAGRQMTPQVTPAQPARTWRATMLLGCVAAIFGFAVFSQDVALSQELYEPVSVRIAGLEEGELDAVRVSRLDLRGRWVRLVRSGNGWGPEPATHVCGLRVEVPQALASRIGLTEVAIGERLFSYPPLPADHWRSVESGSTNVIESTPALSLTKPWVAGFQPIINWAGDRRHLQTLARHTGAWLLLLAAMAWALERLGRLAHRGGALAAGDWRPLRASLVWVAALAGPPLYVLQRHGELYYGGTTGLIDDTFRSLIRMSFYGRTYHELQVEIVLAAIAGSVAAAALLLAYHYRRGTLARLAPLTGMLAVMVLVSAAVVAQMALFGTPYPFGRTALPFVPLYLLFVTFLCDGLADLGRPLRMAAAVTLVAAVLLSGYHVSSSANVTFMLEWRGDAATKMMVADLERAATRDEAAPRRVSLGVEPSHFPVAVFYAAKSRVTDIHIEVLPTSNRVDYAYVPFGDEHPPARVIARYPVARSLLLAAER